MAVCCVNSFSAASHPGCSGEYSGGGGGGNRHERIVAALRRSGYQGEVMLGPFKGMKYSGEAIGSLALPKMIGSYERELHAIIESIAGGGYDKLVDIGAAEGYYAVGLARSLPSANIIAFEVEEKGRRLVDQAARDNGVSHRVESKGRCDRDQLDAALSGHKNVVICDCEGEEFELLDPDHVPKLAETTMLVELHEFIQPGVREELLARFGNTHWLTLIDAADRGSQQFPGSEVLSKSDRFWALDEGRPSGMQWLWMRPRCA